MLDTTRLNLLDTYLYSAFPAKMTTGHTVWMVNLRVNGEIIHAEGKNFRDALDQACRKLDDFFCEWVKEVRNRHRKQEYAAERVIHLFEIICPHCSHTLWVNNGNILDITAPDVDAVRCPWCGEAHVLGDERKKMFDESMDPKDYWVEDGYKTPKEAVG